MAASGVIRATKLQDDFIQDYVGKVSEDLVTKGSRTNRLGSGDLTTDVTTIEPARDSDSSRQRLRVLMQEFKVLLESHQEQSLKLVKSFATITKDRDDINLTEMDDGLEDIGVENISDYESSMVQLTQTLSNTLSTMESELEASLRKSEYQELSRQDMEIAHLEMLEHLANTSEERCNTNFPNSRTLTKGKHIDRVGELCSKIAQTLGCDAEFIDKIAASARLHDIGKVAIPDAILQKPDRLDSEEYATMKMHTIHGAEMLNNNSSEIVQMAQRIALSHHENWDGTGYPYQLKEEEITLEGRIVAVADVYDALISSRIYKDAWPKDKAIEQIKSRSGTKFDPKVVTAFLEVIAE